jgi:hypothetical protein
MLPLTDANILAPLIVGFAFEQMALDSLIEEFKDVILRESEEGSTSEAAVKLHQILKSRGQKLISVESTQVYEEPPEASKNVSIWLKAKSTSSARDVLTNVRSVSR